MRLPEASAARPLALVVDDDEIVRILEQATLSQYDFDVVAAADGDQALSVLADTPASLILLDLDMPGTDGFEVCRRIRQRWDATELPVIVVTGMDDLDSLNRAYQLGANDFISKPIYWRMLGYRARYALRSAQAGRALHHLENKQAAMIRAMPDTIFVIGRDGSILDCRQGSATQPFVASAECVGKTLGEALPGDVAARMRDCLRLALEGGALQSMVYRLPLAEGMHDYEARFAASDADEVVVVVRDITLERANEARIRQLAYYDKLTGMPNRHHFIERLEGELARARRNGRKVALLFIDLDGFKAVNDSLGHEAGDRLLQAVAERLKERLRASDTISRLTLDEASLHFARLGGDEFTVVLPELDDVQIVVHIAERVQRLLTAPFEIDGHRIAVTASIGIAIFPDDGDDAGSVLKHADMAMYRAKDRGRNNWQMYGAG